MDLILGKVLNHKENFDHKAVVIGETPDGNILLWAYTGHDWRFEAYRECNWSDNGSKIVDVLNQTTGDIIKQVHATKRLKTCEHCPRLASVDLNGTKIFSCGVGGMLVPQYSEAGKPTIFHRVPLECPRPGTEVIKQPYIGT